MSTQSFKLEVSPVAGKVSAKYIVPDKPICILTLAHGAGAGMDHLFMETLANALAKVGIATLRFNFPFAEHKKGRPDSPAIAHLTIEAAIAKARDTLDLLYARHTGQSIETIRRDTERDNFMTSEEAKQYGLIDEVLTSGKRTA